MANRFSNFFNKANNRADNGKDFDVMNPEEDDPVAKAAKSPQVRKALRQAGKAIFQALKSLVELIIPLIAPVIVPVAIILIIVVVISAWNMMPGMMKNKLAELFKIDTSEWFMNGAAAKLDEDYKDIIGVLNYLEEMNYSLVGDGFVVPKIEKKDHLTADEVVDKNPSYSYKADENGKYHFYDGNGNIVSLEYYNDIGQVIDNSTGEPKSEKQYIDEFGIRRSLTDSNETQDDQNKDNNKDKNKDENKDNKQENSSDNKKGKVVEIKKEDLKYYQLIRTYLLSNYRIYTLKNEDETALKTIYSAIKQAFGGNKDAWAKGLIKLYNAEGGIAKQHWWWGTGLELGTIAKIDGHTLSLQNGIFNNAVNFNIDGWAPRYGMSLEFLLSLHLGTNAPDLVNAMLQNFDTEVQVYLDDSGESKVNASYIDPLNKVSSPVDGNTLDKVNSVLLTWGQPIYETDSSPIGGLAELVNNFAMTKSACWQLLNSPDLTLTSPENCQGVWQGWTIERSTDENKSFLMIDVSENLLGKYGIKNEVDPEVYSIFDEYENYTYNDENGNSPEFNVEHCTQSINKDTPGVENDTYTYFEQDAKDFGFSGKMTTPEVNEEFYRYFKPDSSKDNPYKAPPTIGGDVYDIKRVVNSNEWIGTHDEEEVGYEWRSYKYLIYKIGSYTQEATDYALGNDGTYNAVEWGEKKITETGKELVDVIMVEFIVREKTEQEAIDAGAATRDENGVVTYKDTTTGKCSEQRNQGKNKGKCCSVCQKYVKAAVKAMASVSDQDFHSFTPYIARVLGSWFRDTYFIVPKDADPAISEYAGGVSVIPSYTEEYKDSDGKTQTRVVKENAIYSIAHPEVNIANAYSEDATFVAVDEEYLGDSGEYWTAYEKKGENEYQLYVLKADGSTSRTTLEEFIEKSEIDGEPAYVDGEKVEPGHYGSTGTSVELQRAKEKAEKDGWAFVKKALTTDVKGFINDGHTAGIDSSEEGKIDSKVLWSAYGFDSKGSTSGWEKVKRSDKNEDVNKLYDIIYGNDSDGEDDSGIFYQLEKTNNVTQVEDAQRGETNPLVKYLFKYRKYYLYDGGESKGVQIEHDRKRVLYGYDEYISKYDTDQKYYTNKVVADKSDIKDCPKGITIDNFYKYEGVKKCLENEYKSDWRGKVKDLLNKYGRSAIRQSYSVLTFSGFTDEDDLATQWLDWQLDMYYMDKYGIDLKAYYHINTDKTSTQVKEDLLKLKYDPRDPDLIGTVEITKSSLSVFSILENTGTLDADYAYRDFKELIVELNYFDKEDLSSKKQSVFTWLIPNVTAVGWPNRPWDKLDVDYGTLVQPHINYVALGVDYVDGTEGNVNESKIAYIGDTWMAKLKDSKISTSKYFYTKDGANADSFTGNNLPKIPSDATAIVLSFGFNDPSEEGAEKTKTLIKELNKKYPKIPIYVLRTSHVAEGYSSNSGNISNAGEINSKIDEYNKKIVEICNEKDNVRFVDATKKINENGYLKEEYSEDDKCTINKDGLKVWFESIVNGIALRSYSNSNNAEDSSAETNGTGTTTTTEPDGTGDNTTTSDGSDDNNTTSNTTSGNGGETVLNACKEVIANFKKYGWGYVRSGYVKSYKKNLENAKKGKKTKGASCAGTVSWIYQLAGYLPDGKMVSHGKNLTGKKQFENWGKNTINCSWYYGQDKGNTSVGKTLEECEKEGLVVPGDIVIYKDTIAIYAEKGCKLYGCVSSGHIKKEKSNGIKPVRLGYCANRSSRKVKCIVHPDGPGGVGNDSGAVNTNFLGYDDGDYVTSPVTGKILEIGKHERINIYTGEMKEVEFIKIQVMNSSNYFDNIIDSSKDAKKEYGYETKTEYELKDALNLFYDEYKDVCDGYIVTLDGFDVDLSLEGGEYKQNEVTALYNSGQMTLRKNKEQAKEDAPFLINNGEKKDFPEDTYIADSDSLVGYYIKEGKYIGITTELDEPPLDDEEELPLDGEEELPLDGETGEDEENDDAVDDSSNEGNDETQDDTTPMAKISNTKNDMIVGAKNKDNKDNGNDDENTNDTTNNTENTEDTSFELPDKLTYTYEDFAKLDGLTGDYIRIQVMDNDMAIVDDVERFFYIPEPDEEDNSFNAVSQEYKAAKGDLEVLAEVIYHECGKSSLKNTTLGEKEEQFNGYCMGYSVVNKLLEQNKKYYGIYYDTHRQDMSPLVQTVTNQKYTWYASVTKEAALKVHNGGKGTYSEYELEIAEYCLTFDCTSVQKPFETKLGNVAKNDGYSATAKGSPIPRAMCQQGGYGDGASGQSKIILVGFTDMNKNGTFDVGDELFGVDRSMESLIGN